MAAGKVLIPSRFFGPGAKNAGLKVGMPEVMIGPPPIASRSVSRNETIGFIESSPTLE